MKEWANRIARWARTGKIPAGPLQLEIRPTSRCNLKCSFCKLTPKKSAERPLPAAKYEEIIGEAAGLTTREVQITGGGEPLVAMKQTMAVVRQAKRSGIEGVLITNATLLDGSVAAELVDTGWEMLLVSLDAPDEKTHDLLRRRSGVYGKVMSNIDRIEDLKAKRRSRLPMVRLIPLITNKIHSRLQEFVDLCMRHSLNGIWIQPMVVRTPAGKRLQLDPEQRKEFQETLEDSARMADSFGLVNNFRDFIDRKVVEHSSDMGKLIRKDLSAEPYLKVVCFYPWLFMGIQPDGTAQPCPMTPSDEPLPSVRDRSLSEIWNSDYFNGVRESMLARKLPYYCEKCCGSLVLDNRVLRRMLAARMAKCRSISTKNV